MTKHPFAGILCLATSAALCLAALTRLPLRWPPFVEPHRIATYLTDVGALGAAISLFASLAACGAAYVLVVSLVAAVASIGRPHGVWARIARTITVPALRWALPGAVGLTILIAPAGTANASTPHDDDTIVMLVDEPAEFRLVDPTTTTQLAPTTIPQATADPPSTALSITPTLPATSNRRTTSTRPAASILPSTAKQASRGSTTTTAPAPTIAPAPTTAPMARPAVPVRVPNRESMDSKPVRKWTVEPGDHLWHIAQATLATDLGHPASDAETVDYWRQLITANRPYLVDPDNPDLILPGQQLVVPTHVG